MAIKAAEALQLLQDEFGSEGFDEAMTDSVCPGVCMNCTAITDDCEPDARANWCHQCNQCKVRSWPVLAGVM